MTRERFEQILEAHGADPARWPAAERAAAAAFAERPEAAALLSEAAALDALLDGAETPPPGELLQRRIIKAGQAAVDARSAPRWRPAAAGMAASLLLGFSIGFGGALMDRETAVEGALAALEQPAYLQAFTDEAG